MRGIFCDKCGVGIPFADRRKLDTDNFMNIRINVGTYDWGEEFAFDLCNSHKAELLAYLGNKDKEPVE